MRGFHGRPYLSISETARHLRISRSTLTRMRDNGELPPMVKVGNRLYLPASRLAERFPELLVISTADENENAQG